MPLHWIFSIGHPGKILPETLDVKSTRPGCLDPDLYPVRESKRRVVHPTSFETLRQDWYCYINFLYSFACIYPFPNSIDPAQFQYSGDPSNDIYSLTSLASLNVLSGGYKYSHQHCRSALPG